MGAGQAGPRDFRTPPLWGLAKSAPYMHDEAAATREQVIAQHEGEALSARHAYERLSQAGCEALGALLRSL